MSYSGSTASSSVANPPNRVSHGLLAQTNNVGSTSVANGGAVWAYSSTNLTTDMTASNFFTDAQNLGMRNGDILISGTYSTESSTGHILVIGMITGVSTSGANLSTGGTITSTFA
jgi:hypothetical protein